MRWGDERYVKMYTRQSPDWRALPWEARALWHELLKQVDRAGTLAFSKPVVLALAVNMPPSVVETALNVLAEDGCIALHPGGLTLRNFVDAQETQATPASRKRLEREVARDQAINNTADVTRCHTASRDVTPCHDPEEPSPAQLSPDQFRLLTQASGEQPPPPTGRKGRKGKGTPGNKPPDPRHRPLQDAWMAAYERAKGHAYPFAADAGTNAKSLSRALAKGDGMKLDFPAILARVDWFFGRDWTRENGASLAVFASHFERLGAPAATGPPRQAELVPPSHLPFRPETAT